MHYCIVHGVCKSQTRLIDFHFHFSLALKHYQPLCGEVFFGAEGCSHEVFFTCRSVRMGSGAAVALEEGLEAAWETEISEVCGEGRQESNLTG